MPPACRRRSTPPRYGSIRDIFAQSCSRFAAQPAFTCMDRTLTYARARPALARLRRVAAERGGARARRARRDHDAQPAPVPGGALRRRCARAAWWSTATRSTRRASSSTSSNDSGRRRDRDPGELRARRSRQVIARTEVKTVVTTQVGDLLGFPQVAHHQLRREAREEDGARRGTCRAPSPSATRSPPGAASRSRSRRSTHDDLAFLQYTGGTTGVSKGAMLTHGNIVANLLQTARVVGPGPARGRGDHHHRAAAVPHLRAHRELPRVHEDRRRTTS